MEPSDPSKPMRPHPTETSSQRGACGTSGCPSALQIHEFSKIYAQVREEGANPPYASDLREQESSGPLPRPTPAVGGGVKPSTRWLRGSTTLAVEGYAPRSS